jgi:hypothetical protein
VAIRKEFDIQIPDDQCNCYYWSEAISYIEEAKIATHTFVSRGVIIKIMDSD